VTNEPSTDTAPQSTRLAAYRSRMKQAGQQPRIVYSQASEPSAYDATRTLLEEEDQPTAIFAGSDEQAFGVVEAARTCGLSVPGDLSVVGFDDLPMSRWASPPLTTVRQPLAQMGRAAAQMLQSLMEGRALNSCRVELSTALIVRSSTAPPH